MNNIYRRLLALAGKLKDKGQQDFNLEIVRIASCFAQIEDTMEEPEAISLVITVRRKGEGEHGFAARAAGQPYWGFGETPKSAVYNLIKQIGF